MSAKVVAVAAVLANAPVSPTPATQQSSFYQRVFQGQGMPAAPDLHFERLRADVPKLLDRLCETRVSWRGPEVTAEKLVKTLDAVVAEGQLHPDLLAQAPALRETLRKVGRSRRADFNDLFYSLNVLAQRAESREDLLKDFAWLYGTYR